MSIQVHVPPSLINSSACHLYNFIIMTIKGLVDIQYFFIHNINVWYDRKMSISLLSFDRSIIF